MNFAPTIPIPQVTGNNTSTSDAFVPWPNGNIGPCNVSKVNIRELLYPGFNGRVFAHLMAWWQAAAYSGHPYVGYASDDPAQVARQLADMQSRGCDGVLISWYGIPKNGKMTQLWLDAAAKSKTPFSVGIIINEELFKTNSTAALTAAINSVYSTYCSQPAYFRHTNRPVIGVFMSNESVDWTAVRKAIPVSVMIMRENAFDANADVNFGWGAVDPAAYYDWFYKTSLAKKTVTMAPVSKGFNDTDPKNPSKGVWGAVPPRVVPQDNANRWLYTFSSINKYYSTALQLPFVQLVTWNDYQEGTALECGIDAGLKISTNLNGKSVSWTLAGNAKAMHHVEIWATQDGALMQLVHTAQIPDAPAYDLSTLQLPAGSYKIYLALIGIPCIKNAITQAGIYTQKQLVQRSLVPRRKTPPIA